MKKLDEKEIKKKLEEMSGWVEKGTPASIEKKFTFENFTDAVCFLNQVAEIANEEDHHPDLHLTSYKHLRIVLSTHSEGGLTRKDFIVAGKIDALPI